MEVINSYNGWLIILSIMIAVLTSYAGFDFYFRKGSIPGHLRSVWLICGGLAIGIGSWCAHFMGILGVKTVNQLRFDSLFVWVLLLISIILSFFSLYYFSKKMKALLPSVFITLSWGLINFAGIGNFHKDVVINYYPFSMIIALFIGFIGTYTTFRIAVLSKHGDVKPIYLKLLCGTFMGLSMAGLQFIGLRAISVQSMTQQLNDSVAFSIDLGLLTFGIGLAMVLLLLIVLVGIYIIEKIASQSIKLDTNEQYYKSLYDQNPDLIITCDLEGNFLSTNKVVEFYGYTEKELLNRSFSTYLAPECVETTIEHFHIALSGQSTNFMTSIIGKSEEKFELNVTNIPILTDHQVTGVYSIIKDITDLKKSQKALAEAEANYRSLVENSLTGIYIIQNGKIVYINPKLLDMMGYREDEVKGVDIIRFIHPEDRSFANENIVQRLSNASKMIYEYRGIKKDQSTIHLEVRGSTMLYRGKPAVVGTVLDISDRKKAEETIKYMAYHDDLTGLPNRHYFCENLKAALSESPTLALLYIDLDHFKLVSDAMGHGRGNQLLKIVSERLSESLQNQGVVGRNNGDEFLIYLPNVDREAGAAFASHILDSFTTPFNLDQYELFVTPSIGISLYPNDAEDVEDLIKKANSAMYRAKRSGKNNYQFYNSRDLEQSYERLELETDLRKALENHEFELHYQPKVDLMSGKIIGAEALIRWQHPVKGFLSPDKFIPLAEKMGLIIPLGEWIIRTACMQAKKWQESGLPPIVISVNLSVLQLYQPHLVEMLRDILQESGLKSEYLELEITETMMMDSDRSLKVLNELKHLGLKISLDDFGTGYSSLFYLKDAPIDTIKIDQSFVRQSTTDANAATIVKTIIAMAHQLKLNVIAEGVESKDHLILLQNYLCNEAQGYLFSKPLPPEVFVEKYDEIEQVLSLYGISKMARNDHLVQKTLENARDELFNTVRLQHGITFKFVKKDDKFIHTFCDGELIYQMGLLPEQIIGKELIDFYPKPIAEQKVKYYERAWHGEMSVTYVIEVHGIKYIGSLRPIIRAGKVVEVIGSCVDITEHQQIEEVYRIDN